MDWSVWGHLGLGSGRLIPCLAPKQEEMDSNPMVSSLLNKLANYTNLSQGVVEHEEAEDSRRREVKVTHCPHPGPLCFSIIGHLVSHPFPRKFIS